MTETATIRPSLAELAEILGGRLLQSDGTQTSGPACIDSRRLSPGDLFVALPGASVDGHAFLDRALRAGACGALVRRDFIDEGGRLPNGLAALCVVAPLEGLARYGAHLRSRSRALVIGLTGSNGKTTTKEMLAAILAAAVGPRAVLRTEGNLNNHIGVPLTLTRIGDETRFAVVEMGMNHPGEIAELASLARPSVGVVTSIGRAHLEGLGSLEGVARAKAELFDALPDEGIAVYPAGQAVLEERAGRLAPENRWPFGFEANARVLVETSRAGSGPGQHLVITCGGQRLSVDLQVPGRHNALDAAAAAATALALGLGEREIVAGLRNFRPAAHRSVITKIGGAQVLDDCYNANPTSMEAALAALTSLPGRSGAILGDMAELGPEEEDLHGALLERAVAMGVERLILVGPLMAKAADRLSGRMTSDGFALRLDAAAAGELAADWFGEGWNVLVKASRTTGLERALDRWRSLVGQRR